MTELTLNVNTVLAPNKVKSIVLNISVKDGTLSNQVWLAPDGAIALGNILVKQGMEAKSGLILPDSVAPAPA